VDGESYDSTGVGCSPDALTMVVSGEQALSSRNRLNNRDDRFLIFILSPYNVKVE